MVNVQVSGLVLDDASVGVANGTADGVDAIAVAIVCGGKVTAQAEPGSVDEGRRCQIYGQISNAGKLRLPRGRGSREVRRKDRGLACSRTVQ